MKVEQPGVTAFTELSDVPHSYLGEANQHLAVNALETGIDFVPGGGGGGSPGGADGAVQYNNAGAFGGGELLWDESSNNLDTTNGTVIAVNYRIPNGPYTTTLSSITTTDNRNVELPDADGTIALLSSLSIDSSATSGPATYNNTTGVFSIPNYSSGGGSVSLTEIEVDMGDNSPSKRFTITDPSVLPTNKILVFPSPNEATGRRGNDWEVDQAFFTALAGTGDFLLSVVSPYRMRGNRKLYYQVI